MNFQTSQQQTTSREMFEFQGLVFYKNIILDLSTYKKPTIKEINPVFNSNGDFVGQISWGHDPMTFEPYKQFVIISNPGHHYIYNLETEKLIHFQYALGWEGRMPTHHEIEKLETFTSFVNENTDSTLYMGVFHTLDFEEIFPEQQIQLFLK